MKLLDYLGFGSGINASAPSSAAQPVAQSGGTGSQGTPVQLTAQQQQQYYQSLQQQMNSYLNQYSGLLVQSPQNHVTIQQLGNAAGGVLQYPYFINQTPGYPNIQSMLLPAIKHEFTPELIQKFQELYKELNTIVSVLPPDAVKELQALTPYHLSNQVYFI